MMVGLVPTPRDLSHFEDGGVCVFVCVCMCVWWVGEGLTGDVTMRQVRAPTPHPHTPHPYPSRAQKVLRVPVYGSSSKVLFTIRFAVSCVVGLD